jgi:hypothetical protein
MRGKARIFAATEVSAEGIKPFPRSFRHIDPRANDPRLDRRQTWALQIAFLMIVVDGLDLRDVHQLMLSIDEYVTGCADDLPDSKQETH